MGNFSHNSAPATHSLLELSRSVDLRPVPRQNRGRLPVKTSHENEGDQTNRARFCLFRRGVLPAVQFIRGRIISESRTGSKEPHEARDQAKGRQTGTKLFEILS